MSLNANTLSKNKDQSEHIKRIVYHILARIDDDLKEAHESGKKSISMTVPITFSIPHMKNKDAQREIYCGILQSLIKRNFNPKIEIKEESTIFHVTWLSKDELKDIEKQNSFLARYTI